MTERIAILGGGAMGSACAVLAATHGEQDVRLWVRDADAAETIARTRVNDRYLPHSRLDDAITVTADAAAALDGAGLIVAAVPCQQLRGCLEGLADRIPDNAPVVSVIKGIESETSLRPSEVVHEVLGDVGVVALAGPSHAEEIAGRMPTAVVAASGDVSLAERVQHALSTDRFRIYTHRDLVGAELAGGLKNVIAIAAGICDGLGLGDNAKSTLVSRGVVEITRVGTHLGAESETFHGLAGVGDLMTTCFSGHSRNRGVGERLGKGEPIDEILASMHTVAEGVPTARGVKELADREDLDAPIITEVDAVLFGGKPADKAVHTLMTRPRKAERLAL
ncbi:MAG: NAD(P)H-dependent glycerol-3-phosphate dehydrogenase [Planctomycetota bacterium]